MSHYSLLSRALLRWLAVAILAAGVLVVASSAVAGARTSRCPAIDSGSLRNVVAIGVRCRSANYLLMQFATKRRQWKQRLVRGNTTFVAGQSRLYGWDCYASGLVQHHHVRVFGLVCTRGLRTASATLKVR